jgi:hypothetical protein
MQAFCSDDTSAVEAELVRMKQEVAELDAAWEALESRHDFRADQQRETLRPKLAAKHAEVAQFQRASAALRQRDAAVTALRPVHAALDLKVRSAVRAITARSDTPSRETVVQLWADGRALEQLRAVLFEATRDDALRRPYDPLDAVRFFWHQQHEERQRVFTHFLSKPHLPALSVPAWADDLAKLKTLQREVA